MKKTNLNRNSKIHKKWTVNVKEMLAMILSLTFVVCIFSSNSITKATESNTIEFVYKNSYYYFDLNNKFDNADLNEIIFYIDNIPIYKYQILEKNIPNDPHNKGAHLNYTTASTASYTQHYAYVSSPYTCAEVKTTTSAPSFSQTAYVSYLTASLGSLYAQSLTSNKRDIFLNQLVSILVGYGLSPAAGLTYDLVSSFNSARNASVAEQIWKITNAGKKVKISHASSNYGSGYGVFEWTGTKIETYRSYSGNTTTEVLNYVRYY